MNKANLALSAWNRTSGFPGGKWLFSRLVCWKAPYFASIHPRFEVLRPGLCEVRMTKRRSVLNHIGTIHAIAMCNMVELAGGTMTDATTPPSHRWIPKGMTVQYLQKAETSLRAIAKFDATPEFGGPAEFFVTVDVIDTNDQTVLRAVITMWISPRKE